MAQTEIMSVQAPNQQPPVPQPPIPQQAPPVPQGVPVKIFVAVPTTKEVPISWVTAFQQMMQIMPPGSSYTPISQYGVAESRERLVDIFMSMPDMTHILFWDTDILPPTTVDAGKPVWLSMLEDGAPIVAGIYANSLRTGINGWVSTGPGLDGIETHQVINLAVRPNLTNLFPVDLLGFGFVLISRPVFQQLIDKQVERPWFRYLIGEKNAQGRPEMMSEDFYFVKKIVAANLGIKPVIDQRIQCIHMRVVGFRPDGSLV